MTPTALPTVAYGLLHDNHVVGVRRFEPTALGLSRHTTVVPLVVALADCIPVYQWRAHMTPLWEDCDKATFDRLSTQDDCEVRVLYQPYEWKS